MFLLLASAAHAQELRPELRLDVLGPRPYSVQPGAGVIIPLGTYVRTSLGIGWGKRRTATSTHDEWRGDLLTRVILDPFRQQRWALSIGGGLSVRRQTYLAAIVDLEGPEMAGALPAIQVGVSGGVRAALILRRARQGRR
jgi:hypothetical protein